MLLPMSLHRTVLLKFDVSGTCGCGEGLRWRRSQVEKVSGGEGLRWRRSQVEKVSGGEGLRRRRSQVEKVSGGEGLRGRRSQVEKVSGGKGLRLFVLFQTTRVEHDYAVTQNSSMIGGGGGDATRVRIAYHTSRQPS
ncbi:hypothetical protein BgiMline_027335 [Biomphalaria glabrata]|nr:hypothetical protein BgiMline_025133 [Biomphalaria glabrata]